MKTLGILLRNNNSILANAVRGPKKKKDEVKIQSNEIINIFKDREDPEPGDIRDYPLFVQQLGKDSCSYYDLMNGIENNIDTFYPTKASYKSFLGGMKKQRFKTIRQYKQLDSQPLKRVEKNNYMSRVFLKHVFKATEDQIAEEERKEREELEKEQDD